MQLIQDSSIKSASLQFREIELILIFELFSFEISILFKVSSISVVVFVLDVFHHHDKTLILKVFSETHHQSSLTDNLSIKFHCLYVCASGLEPVKINPSQKSQ